MDRLVVLVAAGRRGRLQIMEYFGGLFQRLEPKPGYVGTRWRRAGDFSRRSYPEECLEEIQKA